MSEFDSPWKEALDRFLQLFLQFFFPDAYRDIDLKVISVEFYVNSPDAMIGFGRQLADQLFPGANVALVGQLGAGKTFLVKAVAEALGMDDSRQVTSPTFVLIQEYAARIPIYHFDAYRLDSPAQFFDLGVEEYFSGDGVCFVEWADRVQSVFPKDHLRIAISITGPESRNLQITGSGSGYELLLQQLAESHGN